MQKRPYDCVAGLATVRKDENMDLYGGSRAKQLDWFHARHVTKAKHTV